VPFTSATPDRNAWVSPITYSVSSSVTFTEMVKTPGAS
jgi:hypothetical protein